NGVITRLMRDREDWEEYLSRDQSFYNNYFIDKGAKGILPWLEQWISEGKTLFDPSFATNYLGKIEKIFGSELRSPQVVLRQMMLVADNSFGEKFSPKVREIFKPSRLSYSEGNWSDERLLQD